MNRAYVIGALFLVIIVGGLIAFGSVSLARGAMVPRQTATEPVVSHAPIQATTVKGTIGDRVAADGVAVTVTGVEWKDNSTDNSQTQGKRWLLVHVIVENTNSSFDLDVSAGDFEMKRPNGQLIDFSPESIASDQLVETTLAPGGKGTATVVFQLPASDENLHLQYDYNDQHIDIDLGP